VEKNLHGGLKYIKRKENGVNCCNLEKEKKPKKGKEKKKIEDKFPKRYEFLIKLFDFGMNIVHVACINMINFALLKHKERSHSYYWKLARYIQAHKHRGHQLYLEHIADYIHLKIILSCSHSQPIPEQCLSSGIVYVTCQIQSTLGCFVYSTS
jgi:hypothetical protein